MPRINGWWDEIAPSVEGLTQNIQGFFRPDLPVQMALQKAMVTDPSVVNNIANMDPATRAAYIQTLGLKNHNFVDQLQSIPQGAEGKMQQRKLEAFGRADQGELDAALTGTRTADQQTAGKAGARTAVVGANVAEKTQDNVIKGSELDVKGKEISNSIGQKQDKNLDLEVRRNEALMAGFDKALKAYPDVKPDAIRNLAIATMNGSQVDANLVTRINSDPALKATYEGMLQAMMQQASLDAQLYIHRDSKPSNRDLILPAVRDYMNAAGDRASTALQRVRQLQSDPEYVAWSKSISLPEGKDRDMLRNMHPQGADVDKQIKLAEQEYLQATEEYNKTLPKFRALMEERLGSPAPTNAPASNSVTVSYKVRNGAKDEKIGGVSVLEVAKMIASGQGTLDQLKASGAPQTLIARVRDALEENKENKKK